MAMRWRRSGFTLIELLVVIAIMAGVIAMAAPRLLPALLYSTHEGAARRLMNYGTAAIAEAALRHEKLTFRFDFATQEYWVETLPKAPDEQDPSNTAFGDNTKDKNGFPKDDVALEQMAAAELAKQNPNGKRTEEGNKLLDEQARRMYVASWKRQRSLIGARADHVKQDERVLPRSQQKGTTTTGLAGTTPAETPPEPVVLGGALLGRTRLPGEVKLTLASVGGQEMTKGVVEVELNPAGLDVEAKFWLTNTEGRVFVVTWDPATGQTRFEPGASK